MCGLLADVLAERAALDAVEIEGAHRATRVPQDEGGLVLGPRAHLVVHGDDRLVQPGDLGDHIACESLQGSLRELATYCVLSTPRLTSTRSSHLPARVS